MSPYSAIGLWVLPRRTTIVERDGKKIEQYELGWLRPKRTRLRKVRTQREIWRPP